MYALTTNEVRVTLNLSATTTTSSAWRPFWTIEPKAPAPLRKCRVCGQRGPGLMDLDDGQLVHRWPCRDRMR